MRWQTRLPAKGTRLRKVPLLVGAAVARVNDELRSFGGIGGGVVEAHAGGRVDQLATAFRLPLLVGAAVACPPLDERPVGVLGAGDVHAAAVDGERPVAVDGPVLRGGVAVARPHLHLVAVGAAGVIVVDAVGAVVAGHDRPGRPAAAARSAVAGRDDVGLDGGLGRGGRVAAGHDALVEGAGRALTVVAADAEDDRALLLHRVVAGRANPAEVGREAAGLGVAAEDGPLVGPALDHGRGETIRRGRVGRVKAGVGPGEQAVLHVGHDPGAVARAEAPGLLRAEVDGLHRA